MNHQFFFYVYLRRRWIALPALLLASLTLFVFDLQFGIGLAYVLAGLAIFYIGGWIRAYLDMQVHGENHFNASQDHEVTVEIDDSEINFSTESGTSAVDLKRINRVQESKDFLFLFRNETPIVSLPKEYMSTEAVEFIRKLK